ncbi:MAG: hypothetical protein LBT46_09315 [Planctomycetaceae bacterium]|jgi:hypothetical protein|nr:hypothetical protein [Planctomycetaceae bacterium]
MNTTRYILIWTVWAAVLPGLCVSFPVCLLLCFVYPPAGIPLTALLLFLFYRFHISRKRFAANLRTGNVPQAFAFRVLPFFLPLFYALLVTAVAFFFAPYGAETLTALTMWGLPHYFPLTAFFVIGIAIGGGIQELIPLVPCAASLLTAVAGTIYVSKKSPLIPKSKGLLLYSGITVILVSAVSASYIHFRTEILFPMGNDESIVQDERGRHRFHLDDTDLAEYKPFSENNKLVKIAAPALQIENDLPIFTEHWLCIPFMRQPLKQSTGTQESRLNSIRITA